MLWLIERALRGATVSEMALDLGVSHDTVTREIKRGEALGLVDTARDRLMGTLPDAAHVYAELLNPANTAEALHKHSRGWKLKLDAANALNEGLGTFKRETATKVTNTLEMIATEGDSWGSAESGARLREAKRIAYVPADTIDVEALPEASLSDPEV